MDNAKNRNHKKTGFRLLAWLLVLTSFFSTVPLSTIRALALDTGAHFEETKPIEGAETPEETKDTYVIHIGIDGLSNTFFDKLKAEGAQTPNLDALIAGGTRAQNLRALLPAYVSSFSTTLTGASPATNRTTYRYFDVESNQVVEKIADTYKMDAETLFSSLKRNKEASFLASGWELDMNQWAANTDLVLGNEGFKAAYELRQYKNNTIDQTSADILEALNRPKEAIPRYLSFSAMDLRNVGWGKFDSTTGNQYISTLEKIDSKIGDVVEAAKKAGIFQDTMFVIHSLQPIFLNEGKIPTADVAAMLTADTGVQAQELSGHGKSPAPGTKVLLLKQYVFNYAQLYFTKEATDEDRKQVLAYLQDPTSSLGQNLASVKPVSDYPGAPTVFADYILEPVEGKSFASAASNVTRSDILSQYDLFAAFKGPKVPVGGTVDYEASLMDIVPTITDYLGVSNPADVEGKKIDFTGDVFPTPEPADPTDLEVTPEPEEPTEPTGPVDFEENPDMPYVIQIAVDGLSNALFDRLKLAGAKTPNLDKIMADGARVSDNRALLPAYIGGVTTALTGASPASNDTTYRYYDVENNRLVQNVQDTYHTNQETYFSYLKRTGESNFFGSGWSLDGEAFPGQNEFVRGAYGFKDDYELTLHASSGASETTQDITEALAREKIPHYLSLQIRNIRNVGWGNTNDLDARLVTALEAIDGKIGEIMAAADKAGISDKTYFMVHSLSPIFVNTGKVTTLNTSRFITEDTGVKAEELSGHGKAARPGTKVVLTKQYVFNYAQLSFTKEATDQDKQVVLDYLRDSSSRIGKNIKRVRPIEDFPDTPRHFADYILEPIAGKSFCSAASTVTRNDILSEYDLYTALSGPTIEAGTDVTGEPTLMDLVPTIAKFLGTGMPDSVEGKAWTFEQIRPKASITLQYPKDGDTVFQKELTLRGAVDQADAELTINGQPVALTQDGKFEHMVTLDLGRNDLTLQAVNKDGKVSTLETNVSYVVRPEAPEGGHVLYINFDGFADYYLDLALEQGLVPNLAQILEEGVRFTQTRATTPTITNSAQGTIISGALTRYTDNHMRYFNKDLNKVVEEKPNRKNLAETLAEAATRQYLDVLSVNQFTVEDRGTGAGNPLANYVSAGGGISRFDALTNLFRTGQIAGYTYETLPRVMMLYVDELDAYGHNEAANFRQPTAEKRLEKILSFLSELDGKLGELMVAMKEAGVYDQFTFALTSDHGMFHWGQQDAVLRQPEYGNSKLDEIISTINKLGQGYKTYYVYPRESEGITAEAPADADVVVTSYGTAAQISYPGLYDEDLINEKNAVVTEALQQLPYIGEAWGTDRLCEIGVGRKYADLLVALKPPYNMQHPDVGYRSAMGGHGGNSPEEEMVPGLLWGRGVAHGRSIPEEVRTTQFIPTLARLAGINVPLDATGEVLYEALTDLEKPVYIKHFLEAEDQVVQGKVQVIEDKTASSGQSVSGINEADRRLSVYALPMDIEKVDVRYKADKDIMVRLLVNDHVVRNVFFPASDWEQGDFAVKGLNISLKAGDSLTLEGFKSDYPGTLTVDGFELYSLTGMAYETDLDPKPFNLNATPNGDTASEVGFSWYTYQQGLKNTLEIVEGTDPATADWNQAKIFTPDSKDVSMAYQTKGVRYEVHHARATGLEEGTSYLWRVSNGDSYGPVGSFRTDPGRNRGFKAIFMNDPQGKLAGDYEIWGETVHKAQETAPDADLMILPGDFTDTGLGVPNNAWEWERFFGQAQDALMNQLFVPAIGNHESATNQGFKFSFNTPTSELSNPSNAVYSFDYGNVHFSVLNTEMLQSKDHFAPQLAWLEEDLAKTDMDWKVLILHKGLYSVGSHISDKDINEVLIPMLNPLIDTQGVDLVLQGHDHVFARSYPLAKGEVTETGESGVYKDAEGTVYLTVNTAGFKFYDASAAAKTHLFEKYGQPKHQMFSVLDVTSDRLTVDSYDAVTGEVYDSFTLSKSQTTVPEEPTEPLEPIPTPVPGEDLQILVWEDVSSGVWTKSQGDWRIKTNAALEDLLEVRFDNQLIYSTEKGNSLETEAYKLEDGSTILTLKEAFLSQQTEGMHGIHMVFKEGREVRGGSLSHSLAVHLGGIETNPSTKPSGEASHPTETAPSETKPAGSDSTEGVPSANQSGEKGDDVAETGESATLIGWSLVSLGLAASILITRKKAKDWSKE